MFVIIIENRLCEVFFTGSDCAEGGSTTMWWDDY